MPATVQTIGYPEIDTPCRRFEPVTWQLAHLTQLKQLKLLYMLDSRSRFDQTTKVSRPLEVSQSLMEDLLESPAQPVLPPSLDVLCQETSGTLSLSLLLRDSLGTTESFAASATAKLELRAGAVSCKYVSADDDYWDDDDFRVAPTEAANLPLGFRVLELHTGWIIVGSAGYLGGDDGSDPGEETSPRSGVYQLHMHSPAVAKLLCRYFSLAPACYREFWLYGDGNTPAFGVEAKWLPHPDMHTVSGIESFDSLEAAAAAMQQYAADHDLAVSVSGDQTHLHVVRLVSAVRA